MDGLKGLAVLLVICHHTIDKIKAPFYFPILRDWISSGWVGVMLFFIVSAYTLRKSWQLRAPNETFPALRFYLRRAFRILPFYWLNLLLCILFYRRPPLVVLANAMLLNGFFATTYFTAIVPYAWSLCVEETFYWFFPLWVKKIVSVRTALIAIFVGILVGQIWDYWGPGIVGPVENHEFIFGFPLSRYYVFFIGLLTYELLRETEVDVTLKRFTSGKIPWIEIVLLYMFCQVRDHGEIFACLMIWLLLLASLSNLTWIGKQMRRPWIGQLGIACYSMYLLHAHVLSRLEPFKERLFLLFGISQNGELQALVYLPLVGLLTFAVSVVTYTLVERPSIQLGRWVLKLFFPDRLHTINPVQSLA
ncbi:MAG: acyltransferase family protein [Bdellovibrionales bacterium]